MTARRVGPCPACGQTRPIIRGHQVAAHLIAERRDGQIFERRCAGSARPSSRDELLRRHAAGDLTEGQVARALDVDRVEVRELTDAWLDEHQHRHPRLRMYRRDWATVWESDR